MLINDSNDISVTTPMAYVSASGSKEPHQTHQSPSQPTRWVSDATVRLLLYVGNVAICLREFLCFAVEVVIVHL